MSKAGRVPFLAGVVAVLVLAGTNPASAAPVSFAGDYYQDFNTLGQTTAIPEGWTEYWTGDAASRYTDSNPIPTSAIAGMTAGLATSTVVNIDAIDSNYKQRDRATNVGATATSTDRSMGVMPTSCDFSALQLALTNSTGAALDGITASYTLRVWKDGGYNPTPGTWTYNDQLKGCSFFYSTDGATYTRVAALSLTGGTTGSYPSGNIEILFGSALANGATMYLVWADDNADVATPDQPISIDDVHVWSGPDTTPPTILSTTAPDRLHVIVTFSEQVTAATATNTANYAIDKGITVTSALLGGDGRTVTLGTSLMTGGTTYTLSVSDIEDLATPANKIVPPPDPGAVRTFATPPLTVPTIVSATALGQTQVRVVFSEPISTATATAASNYALDLGGAVTGAALAADNLTVTLTTSPLTHSALYTLTVNNIEDRELPPQTILPDSMTTFTVPPAVPPTLVSVVVQDATHVQVLFSKPVTTASATSTANYGIDNGIAVSGAVLGGDAKTVTLTVSALSQGTNYTLTISNIQDLDTPGNTLSPNPTMAGFTLSVLLLSEPFNYTEADGTDVNGLNGGSGWGGPWVTAASGSAGFDNNLSATLVAGLTFSDFPVSGKAVRVTDNNGNYAAAAAASRQIGTGITAGQTVWFSFLCQNNTPVWNAFNSHAGVRKGTTPTQGTLQMNTRIRVGTSGQDMTKGDYSSIDAVQTTAMWASQSYTPVYLIIGQVTNVGGTGSQTEKMWVLSAANYDAIKADGITETELDTVNTAHATTATATGMGWAVTEYIQLFSRHNVGNPEVFTYDELRYGPTLEVVMGRGAPPATPPSVAITAPASGFICGQGMAPIRLTATTTDGTPASVTGVEFFDGAVKLASATSTGVNTWTYSWTTSAAVLGTHSITAKATDGGGLTATSTPIIVKIWIPGDATGNGLVDGLDYNAWQNGYQQPNSTFATGDYDGNGQVDGLDYNVWQNNYNHAGVYQADGFGQLATASAAAPAGAPAPVAAEPGPMAAEGAASTPAAATQTTAPAAASAPHLVAVKLGTRNAERGTQDEQPQNNGPGVMSLTLVFDCAVQVGAGAVEVTGLATGENRGFAQAYDAATRTLVLTWTQALPADVYTVRVVADFVVGAGGGAPLDGEVGDPAAPSLPSGDGTTGGDALLDFAVE